ncbi:MAG: hypothetical protein M3O02_13310 [Acidobacteriota bacterium]|nr:hypothetical protein [Acidobacteriota bacterium]
MQNAKDTFYRTLQSRLAALNPARTLVLRGAVRPGVLVEENELPAAAVSTDAFRLQWTALHLDPAHGMPLATLVCAIRYSTDGTAGNAGMDRGRALAAMDAEIAAALTAAPQHAPKQDFSAASAGTPPTTLATNVSWSDPTFSAIEITGERLARTASVQVFAYQEAGER